MDWKVWRFWSSSTWVKKSPICQYIFWLPKLKELHITKSWLPIRKLLEAIRLAMKRKDFKFFYANIEFCDKLLDEAHYFSEEIFTECQLYFLRKYWSRLSSRPFYLFRLYFVGDLFSLDASFISNKLASVHEIEISQKNSLVDNLLRSQNEMLGFLRNFRYLRTLCLRVISVDQRFYNSLPDLHPYLQRLCFGSYPYDEIQIELPDLHFLSRFEYLFDFDAYQLDPDFFEEQFVPQTGKPNEWPRVFEDQKLIINKKKGAELEKWVNSKTFSSWRCWVPTVTSSYTDFDHSRLTTGYIKVHDFLFEEGKGCSLVGRYRKNISTVAP